MATTTRQRLAGGVLIGVAALAFYIGTQFQGPGLGGSGSGDGGPTSGSPTRPSTSASTGSELVGDEAVMVSTAPPVAAPASPSPTHITVFISGSQYLLSTTGEEAQATPAKLTDVARAALAVPGDGQGIRVRLFRKKDATAGARIDLLTKLEDAGISNEAIQEMKVFIE